jgi:uncharacterized protein YgiM (DUF1202 family)
VRKILAVWCLLVLVTVSLGAQEFPFIGRIQVSNSLNIRSAAEEDANVLGRIKNGEQVVVIGEEGEFYQLQYPKQLEAWLATWLLLNKGEGPTDKIARDKVNVRSGPGMHYATIAQISQGSEVQILEVNKDKWARIGAPNQATAWVSRKFVVAEESLAEHNKKEKEASEAISAYQKAVTAFKEYLQNRAITEEQYVALKGDFDKLIKLMPGSAEASKAKDFQVSLAEFRGVVRLDELKKQEEERLKAREQELLTVHQDKIEKLKKESEPEVRQFEYEGWIDDVGGILFRPASHSLKKGNEVLLYLKSEDIKLDDYTGKHVGVNGEINRFRGWGRIMTVKEIKILHEMPSQFWTAE